MLPVEEQEELGAQQVVLEEDQQERAEEQHVLEEQPQHLHYGRAEV